MPNKQILLINAFFALCVTACDTEGAEYGDQERAGELGLSEAKIPVSDYFIVTRVDYRKCLDPVCGGWFVKRVNADVTRCADGTWQPECHMYELDLSELGLDPDVVEKFSVGFGDGQALVRGSMSEVDIGLGYPADVLVASEAWIGVTGNEPDGHFSRVDSTHVECVTFPCPYFTERALNTKLVDSLANVDLETSGATPAQAASGYAEIGATGLLIAGEHEIISGPAGDMNGMLATEFYSRVQP